MQVITDFIKEHFAIGVYLVALVLSVIHYGKYFDTRLKYFPMIIAYTLFNEVLGHFIMYSESFALYPELLSKNDIIYNIYDVVSYFYYYLFFLGQVTILNFRKTLKILGLSVILVYVTSCFFYNPLEATLFVASLYGSFILVVFVIVYFINRRALGKWEWSWEKYNLVTWIAIGVFIFYLIYPVIYIVIYFNHQAYQEYGLQTILRISILIMYTLISIGFIKSSRRFFR